jgi:hypothetical protein
MSSLPRRFAPLGFVLCSAALVPLGCTQILGIEDTSVATPTIDPLVCAGSTVPSELTATPINTEASVDSYSPSCGAAGSLDQEIGFTAPVTDYYVFDTFGSRFDTVLALYDQCGGSELACNNNAGGVPQSELVRKLEAGQKALVVVEGNAADTGTGSLQVSRVTCPDADLEGRDFPVELSTASFGDDFKGACGGTGIEDRAYHWVAPKDGLFAFRVDSTTFTPAISLLSGPRCKDSSLGCNAAAAGIGHSEVVRRLKKGQPVTLQVDGVDRAGTFNVNVSERVTTCPSAPITNLGITAGKLAQRTLAPSCGAVEVPGGVAGARYELRDKTYSYTVPPAGVGCSFSCTFDLNAAEPLYMYVLQGDDCGGPELSCKKSALVGGGVYKTSVSVGSKETVASPYTIVVADVFGQDGLDPSFDIKVSCAGICLAGAAGAGATSGARAP